MSTPVTASRAVRQARKATYVTNGNGGLQIEWRRNIQDSIDRADHKIDELSTQVSSIRAILDTYAQMAQSYAADRMSKATYEAEHKALTDRVTKLEGTGGRFIAWAGLGVAMAALMLTGSVDIIIGIIWLISHH